MTLLRHLLNTMCFQSTIFCLFDCRLIAVAGSDFVISTDTFEFFFCVFGEWRGGEVGGLEGGEERVSGGGFGGGTVGE